MQIPDRIEVDCDIVACDGGGGVDGHPIVYLKIGPEGSILCPYCSRRFVLRGDAGRQPAH